MMIEVSRNRFCRTALNASEACIKVNQRKGNLFGRQNLVEVSACGYRAERPA